MGVNTVSCTLVLVTRNSAMMKCSQGYEKCNTSLVLYVETEYGYVYYLSMTTTSGDSRRDA